MKRFLCLTALVVLSNAVRGAQVHAAERPNIVFILADDLGVGDIHCFGLERSKAPTPHFDRLAREGMRFTDAHTVASVCVPARVAIMTGRHPWRFQVYRQGSRWGFLGLRFHPDQFTLGDLLRSAGYRTGYVGKWHLGTEMTTRDGKTQNSTNVDYTSPLKIGPGDYGFDYSFILPGSLDMYPYAYARNHNWVGHVTAQKGWSAFNRVGPAAEDFEDYEVLDTFSSEAERFIAWNASKSRPFFLYLALTSPHTPISPREEFQGKSSIGPYGDFLMETDDCVGRVVAALEKAGVTENTLVIATADHGAASYAGLRRKASAGQVRDLENLGHYPSGIYRGYKFSVYEGGLRVPFVARWPAAVPAGTTCKQLISLGDLMATAAEAAGVQLEDAQGPDSLSYLPLLKDPNAMPRRTSMILRSPSRFVVRDGPWKLALCPGSGSRGRHANHPGMEKAWKEAVAAFGREPVGDERRRAPFVQLFNLDDDPGETNNLAAGRQDKVDELIAVLEERIEAGRSSPGRRLANDVPSIEYLPTAPPR